MIRSGQMLRNGLQFDRKVQTSSLDLREDLAGGSALRGSKLVLRDRIKHDEKPTTKRGLRHLTPTVPGKTIIRLVYKREGGEAGCKAK